ncbi:MAG: hypothetical protein JO336_10020, partial [Acidobacteriia bacterium]|nr:hypothetical protein [Terriglobia bacterium]MBV8905665.1 hypothetical protein [Terriglobia bacterium]
MAAPATTVKRLTAGLAAIALVFGAVEAWASRFDMYSDGVSYLDIAEAMLRRDWQAAVNAYWSPLYPAFLAAALGIFKPSGYWEFPVVHLVNFVAYAIALGCFHYFLKGVLSQNLQHRAPSAWLWLALGYALFVWSSLRLVDIATVSPDMLVAASVYLASGVLVRIIAGNHSFAIFALLGIALGFGFLAKAPVLALSVVFLSLALFKARRRAGVISRVLLSLLIMAVIAGPYIARLSAASGKITTGESWRLNAAWYIDHVPRYHWQGN